MSQLSSRLQGAAAIQAMLDLIGAPDVTDLQVSKILCDQELDIRAFLMCAMDGIVDDMNQPQHT